MRRFPLIVHSVFMLVLSACTEKPNHNANWYYYWEKDNVVMGLDRAGSPASRWDWDVEAANQGVYGASHGASDGYVLTDLCITQPAQFPIFVTYISDPNREIPIGATTTFGVEAAAVTMAHEKEHIVIWGELNAGQVDSDGDRLADTREGVGPYDLIVGEKDTWQLAIFIHPNYADYGDNEFLTRITELTGVGSARLDEDWSQGGAQWRR